MRTNSLLTTFMLVLLMSSSVATATHIRAGEISYNQLNLYTFEITAITFTDPTNVSSDRQEIEIFFGDGKSRMVTRSNGNGENILLLQNFLVKKNSYKTIYTYANQATYMVSFKDVNRISGIRNINNGSSENIPFYIETMLSISSFGLNQSPVYALPVIAIGSVNNKFNYNPMPNDVDGDSLVFTFAMPKTGTGEVPNFVYLGTNNFTINASTGEINWVNPLIEGFYNFNVKVTEYRKNNLIGYAFREIQIYINRLPTGITEKSKTAFQCKLSPSPCQGLLFTQYNLPQVADVSFVITNLLGAKVYETEMAGKMAGNHENTIDLSSLNNGIYILTLHSNGANEVIKFIISK